MIDNTQSPEADLDRELEELIGRRVRGTSTPQDEVRLVELQSKRTRMMRPRPRTQRGLGFSRHLYA